VQAVRQGEIQLNSSVEKAAALIKAKTEELIVQVQARSAKLLQELASERTVGDEVAC